MLDERDLAARLANGLMVVMRREEPSSRVAMIALSASLHRCISALPVDERKSAQTWVQEMLAGDGPLS